MLRMKASPFSTLVAPNVGHQERMMTFWGGLLMLVFSLLRKSVSSLLLFPAGLYLLYRSVSGHCYIYDYLGISTLRLEKPLEDDVPPAGVSPRDEVAESSWESFPTSDAPAWTMGRRE